MPALTAIMLSKANDSRHRWMIGLFASAGLLFMVAACDASPTDERKTTIVVGGDVNHEAVHTFEKTHGRHPSREDLLGIHEVWLDNEILYREGLKSPANASLAANREQVIASALRAIEERARPASVPDEELRRWFEGRRNEYDEPARFDFEDAAPSGQRSEADARALAEDLNRGAPVDGRAIVRAFAGRPESNLAQSYGPGVAGALAASRPGQWLPLRTRDGWRTMRLVAMSAGASAAFETRREAIRRDWMEANLAERRRVTVKALRQNYRIEFSEAHECAAEK